MPAAPQLKPSDFPQTGEDARRAIRSGQWTGPTSGMAPGFVQGNLAILPNALASDFMRFCQLNPKPCPLLAAGAPGDPCLPTLGRDLDIRTDLCRYKVFRNGELIDEPTDIDKHWRDDLVIFALGCSFSFEDALMQDGIELRHITNGSTVPMYRTSIPTVAAGPFHGPLVVSMRPLKPADAIRAGLPKECKPGDSKFRWKFGANFLSRNAPLFPLPLKRSKLSAAACDRKKLLLSAGKNGSPLLKAL